MSWNYRVVRHADGTLGLHEVYYRDDGTPRCYTAEPVGFSVDEDEGLHGLTAALETALRDARERPVLSVSEFPSASRTKDV